ncbi:MAG: FCD domain-containing protein [Planctomycetaceae bacterium]|nr:FCD domain-containing protein [Planctomycetaceae bacterium]
MYETSSAQADTLVSRSITMLIDLIRDGKLQRGEKLPPQDILARELGVSRTALREALKELSYRGIIASQHGRGTFVSDKIVAEEETLEARLILEPGIITLAAKRCSNEDVATLRRMCQDMEVKVRERDYEGFSVCDLLFHSALANMAGNQALVMLLATVGDMMLHQQNIVQIIPGAMERAYLFHLDMVEAVAEHNSSLAGDLMRKHLDDVMLTLRVSRTLSNK